MKIALATLALLTLAGCKTGNPHAAGLEKYPACYHKNEKIVKKCIEKNDAGETTTAATLENTAYPGQYK